MSPTHLHISSIHVAQFTVHSWESIALTYNAMYADSEKLVFVIENLFPWLFPDFRFSDHFPRLFPPTLAKINSFSRFSRFAMTYSNPELWLTSSPTLSVNFCQLMMSSTFVNWWCHQLLSMMMPSTFVNWWCHQLLSTDDAINFCQLMMPSTFVNWWCHQLLSTDDAVNFCQLMMPSTFVNWWCHQLLSTYDAINFCQLMMPSTFVNWWCHQLLSTDDAVNFCQLMMPSTFVNLWCRQLLSTDDAPTFHGWRHLWTTLN